MTASDHGRKVCYRISLPGTLVLLFCAFAALFAGPARAADPSENLLFQLSPRKTHGVARANRLTDGRGARPGDFWKTTITAHFQGPDSFVEYDLGEERKISSAWLQGDANDTYEISGSTNGEDFQPIWRAPPLNEVGMRARSGSGLEATARYLRVSVVSGDGSFSLSEVQAFGEEPRRFPPAVAEDVGAPLDRRARDAVVAFGFALIAATLLSFKGAPRWWLAVLVSLAALAGFGFLSAARDGWPLGPREISTVRATFALVAAVAVIRESFFPTRFRAHRTVVLGSLWVSAVLGFMAFYNLGQPQFWDQSRQKWTFVHYLDLRQYYPTAKYFPELGYRGMYEADVAAFVEDGHVNLDSLRELPMRDLSNLRISTVGDQRGRVESVRSKFSPERWSAYKSDAAYFRGSMGTSQYLEMMNDMGGNATPVWMSIAHLLFSFLHASNEAFAVTALLDPLLLLGSFVAIAFVFGLRIALACMLIFGANDFIMYGTNWAGATLRHDWIAYIALGACALRRERWFLGGALLAASATIRAFPALAVVGTTLPALWWVAGYFREKKKLPPLSTVLAEQRPVLRVLAGAAVTTTVLLVFSVMVVAPDAWGDWLSKVAQLSADPHANHISLRSLIAGWGGDQGRILRDRMPVFAGAVFFYVAAVVVASRGKRLEHAAILAMILMPVLFYPANYYIHFVCLLPLLAAGGGEATRSSGPLEPVPAAVVTTLLAMCAAQFMAVLITENGLHFYLNGVLLFIALTVVLALLVRQQIGGAEGERLGGALEGEL